MRFAYADPPYPGLAHYYEGHPDFGGEVDHRELARRLVSTFPDGWALSTSADALPLVLPLVGEAVRELVGARALRALRVASWHRGARGGRAKGPRSAWEPVIYFGGRRVTSSSSTPPTDALEYVARARLSDRRRVIGAKPAAFAFWFFELLGARPGDELADLFPGSGGIARAWDLFCRGRPPAAARDALRAPSTNGSGSVAPSSSANRRGGPGAAGSTLRRSHALDHGATLPLPFVLGAGEPSRVDETEASRAAVPASRDVSEARARVARARAVLESFRRRRDEARARVERLSALASPTKAQRAELLELADALEGAVGEELEAVDELARAELEASSLEAAGERDALRDRALERVLEIARTVH